MPAPAALSDQSAAASGLAARIAGLVGLAAVLGIGGLALRQPLPPQRVDPAVAPVPPDAAAPLAGQPCGQGGEGYLRGPFFGALALEADWTGPGLRCDGGVRPGEAGVRLFFAQPRDGARIVFMIGIDARPEGLVGGERTANVTVIDERDGRFFSSGGSHRCWVDGLQPRPADGGGQWLAGRLYCAGALPSLADRSSLTLGDIHFSGRFNPDGE